MTWLLEKLAKALRVGVGGTARSTSCSWTRMCDKKGYKAGCNCLRAKEGKFLLRAGDLQVIGGIGELQLEYCIPAT